MLSFYQTTNRFVLWFVLAFTVFFLGFPRSQAIQLTYEEQCEELKRVGLKEGWFQSTSNEVGSPSERFVPRTPPALVGAAPEEAESQKCVVCGHRHPAFVCSGCKHVHYCSLEHQTRDWQWHERVCSALSEYHQDEQLRAAPEARRILVARFLEAIRIQGVVGSASSCEAGPVIPQHWQELFASLEGSEVRFTLEQQRILTSYFSRAFTVLFALQNMSASDFITGFNHEFRLDIIGATRVEISSVDSFRVLQLLLPRILVGGSTLDDVPLTLRLFGPELSDSDLALCMKLARWLRLTALKLNVWQSDIMRQ